MRKLLLVFALSPIATVYGQPLLTVGVVPSPGDVITMVSADTTGVQPGGDGNQTWTFTNLQGMDTLKTTYVNPANTPYSSTFATSNLASYVSDDSTTFTYYSKSNGLFEMLGYGSQYGSGTPVNPMTMLEFPLSLGSTFVDSFEFSGSILSMPFTQQGMMSVVADGWGTLVTPSGTYLNVLRVKRTIMGHITSNMIDVSDTSVAWEWYSASMKSPILIITESVSWDLNTSMSEEMKTVEYAIPTITNIGEVAAAKKAFRLAPNPATDRLTIAELDRDASYSIVDMSGRRVLSGTTKPGSYIDISSLQTGVYVLQLQSETNYNPQVFQVIR